MAEGDQTGNKRDLSNERPSYSIFPPALVRHIVYRLHPEQNPRFAEDETVREQLWKNLCGGLSQHANAILAAYGERDPIEILPPSRRITGPLQFPVRRTILVPVEKSREFGYLLRLRIDVYSELFSVTYLIDHIGHPSRDGRVQGGELQQRIAELPRDPSRIDWLYDDVWKGATLPGMEAAHLWTAERGEACPREVGDPLADFRGILLCPEPDWRMGEPRLERLAIERRAKPKIAPELIAFAAAHDALIRAVVGSSEDAQRAAHKPRAIERGSESIVCGMGGGCALYAAELGQWALDTNVVTPLRHLVVYAGRSHAQLGRLVRRMHVLGELRQAAVMDWDLGPKGRDLRHVSLLVRTLGKDVDEATVDPSFDKLAPILEKLAEAGKLGNEGQTGLTYRIEQARFYAEEYVAQLEHLRVVRLGDWQPYDDFVKRYITYLFSRIHRIGNRYEALGRRVDRLIRYESAKGARGYQDHARGMLESIKDTTDLMNRSNSRQVELLKTSEMLASIFLVYYLGSILEHVLIGIYNITSWSILSIDYYYFVWFIAAIGAYAFAKRRAYRLDEQARDEERDAAQRRAQERLAAEAPPPKGTDKLLGRL